MKLHHSAAAWVGQAFRYYNEIATNCNTGLEIVPERFVASATRLRPHPLMMASEFERAPVTVKLAE